MKISMRGRLAMAALIPLAAFAAMPPQHNPEEPFDAAALAQPWESLKDMAPEAVMTVPDPEDVRRMNEELGAERRARESAAKGRRSVASLREWVSDGRSMRPLLSRSKMASFDAPLSPSVDMGRLTQLRLAMAAHAKTQPEGWGALVEKAKAAWAEGGDIALLKTVESLINEVPYVDGTDGTFFSPARLFGRGGVCKDFVAAKYILLRDAGFPAERLRVAVVTPRGPASEWHVVLLALPSGATEPMALDLLPFHVGAANLAKAGQSKSSRVASIKRAGIDPDSVDVESSKLSMATLSELGAGNFSGGLRSLDWVGNEHGGAAFARPLPSAAMETTYAGQPLGAKAYADSDRVWLARGSGAFATISAAPISTIPGGKSGLTPATLASR